MSNFIHFGCWNNLNKGCLLNVTNLLKDRLKDAAKQKIDFLTIAGDNYYPKKEKVGVKKNKIIIPSLLEEGFAHLPKEIPIYMILGNHDLETNTGGNNFFITDLNDQVEKDVCSIINYEQKSTIKNREIEYNLFKEMMLENGTLIIMIDTSMYSVDAYKYLPCYKEFLSKGSDYSVDELKTKQLELIKTAITKYKDDVKNLILIGHHPIIGLKEKDNKNANIQDIIEFDTVLKEIYSILSDDVTYFYLCADVHLYQEGEIGLKIDDKSTMKIKQYIVGTGGTDLDKCPNKSEMAGVTRNERLTYTMTRCEAKCGFLECINTSPVPEFLFNGVPTAGGKRKRRKTRKIKSKKSKRKSKRH